MRTRKRHIVHETQPSDVGTKSYQCIACNGQQSLGTTYVNHAAFENKHSDEVIVDGLGSKVSHRCFHRHYDFSIEKTGDDVIIPSGDPYGVLIYPGTSLWATFRKYEATGVDPSNGWCSESRMKQDSFAWDLPSRWTIDRQDLDETSLKEKCLENARQLKADVLLDIIEGNQIWPSVKSVSMSLPLMARHWTKLKKVLKTASGSFLAWKFGIKPLISDMSAIHAYLPKMAADLKKFRNQQVLRFSATHVLKTKFDATTNRDYSLNNYLIYSRTHQGFCDLEPIVRYVLLVKPTVNYSSKFFSNLDGFMRRFATSPASLAWEKVPFSFVVDWFVDLRGVLRELDSLVGFEPYKIVSFTKSFSYDIESQVFMQGRSPCQGQTLYDHCAGTMKYRHYERFLVSDTANLPRWKPRFGKNQVSVSLALMTQQLLKLRK